MDQLLTIDILGQPFTFKTDSDVAEAQEVADFVVKAVNQTKAEFEKKIRPPDKRAILILTALNITNEYFDLKKKHQEMVNELSQRSTTMLNRLETQLVL